MNKKIITIIKESISLQIRILMYWLSINGYYTVKSKRNLFNKGLGPDPRFKSLREYTLSQDIAKEGDYRSIINGKCCSCIYDELKPGSWRMQVASCTTRSCALYQRRPKSYRKNTK